MKKVTKKPEPRMDLIRAFLRTRPTADRLVIACEHELRHTRFETGKVLLEAYLECSNGAYLGRICLRAPVIPPGIFSVMWSWFRTTENHSDLTMRVMRTVLQKLCGRSVSEERREVMDWLKKRYTLSSSLGSDLLELYILYAPELRDEAWCIHQASREAYEFAQFILNRCLVDDADDELLGMATQYVLKHAKWQANECKFYLVANEISIEKWICILRAPECLKGIFELLRQVDFGESLHCHDMTDSFISALARREDSFSRRLLLHVIPSSLASAPTLQLVSRLRGHKPGVRRALMRTVEKHHPSHLPGFLKCFPQGSREREVLEGRIRRYKESERKKSLSQRRAEKSPFHRLMNS